MEFLSKEGLTYFWSKLKARLDNLTSATNTNTTNIAVQTARIDSIASLPEGSTTGDAELIDVRVGADGKTYASAGDSVRTQVADLKIDRSLLVSTVPSLVWEQGSYNSSSGSPTSATNRIRCISYHNCLGGLFKVNIPYGMKGYVYQFTESLVGSFTASFGWLPSGSEKIFPAGYWYRVLLAYTDNSTILPSAGSDIATILSFTDTTLSLGGKAADASLTFGGKLSIVATEEDPKDLNDIVNMGTYYMSAASVPYTENCPSQLSNNVEIIVFKSSSTANGLIQMFVNLANHYMYYRCRISSGAWTAWELIPVNKHALTNYATILNDTDDLDELPIGIFYYASNSIPQNSPINTGGAAISLPSANSSGSASTQICNSTVGTYIRYRSSAGWGLWTKLASADLGKFFGDVSYNIKDLQTWEQGGINSEYGTDYPSTSQNYTKRIRSKFMYSIPASGLELGIDTEGFKLFVFVYNDGGTYVNNSGWLVPGQKFIAEYGQQLRFVVAYEDDSEILPDANFSLLLKSASSGAFDPIPVLYMTGDLDLLESKDDKVNVSCSIMGTARTGTIKWQGSSSIRYPKKNFTLNKLAIPDVSGDSTGVDAWGMFRTFISNYWRKMGNISYNDNTKLPHASTWGVRRKFVLKANWIDPSMARNIVGARLWSQVVQTRQNIIGNLASSPNYGAVDGFPVQLVVNGVTQGLYTVNISKDENLFGMGSGETEYFVGSESNSSDACKWKATAVCDTTDYEIEYPEGADDEEQATIQTDVAASLNTAITAAINSHDDWETNLSPYLDLESVTDYFIFMCCISGTDNIIKNILYGTYDGTKWFLSAYDMDATFGFDPYGTYLWDVTTSRTQFAEAAANHRLAHLLYKYSPQRLITRYRELRAGVLSEANVWHEFSRFINIIPENAYRKDRDVWTDAPGTSMANISTYMEYYRMHCAYLDAEIDELERSLNA